MNKQTFFLVLFLTNFTLARDSLQYFIKKKHVKNYIITYLGNETNWIEYKYFFEQESNNNKIDITNETLRVGVLIRKGHEFDCRLQTNENATSLKGYSLDIINWLNFRDIDFIILNATTTAIVQEPLLKNEIDVIVCHPNLDFNNNIIKLHPTLVGRHLLIYIPSKLNLRKDIFILSFQGRLWLVFLIVLILLAICLRISTTKYSVIYHNYQPWSWVEITLWAIAAACQQGLSYTPSGFGSCSIFLMGYIMAYLLYTGFAAAITSLLLQHDVSYQLNLANTNMDKFKLVSFRDSKSYLNMLDKQFKYVYYADNLDRLFNYLKEDNTIGFAPDLLIYQYMSRISFNTSTKYVTIETGIKYRKSFYTLENSNWRKSFNSKLSKLEENGILLNLLKRNLYPIGNKLNTISGYSSAGKEHVGSAILILCAGVLFSIIFLCAEFLWSFYKKHRSSLGL